MKRSVKTTWENKHFIYWVIAIISIICSISHAADEGKRTYTFLLPTEVGALVDPIKEQKAVSKIENKLRESTGLDLKVKRISFKDYLNIDMIGADKAKDFLLKQDFDFIFLPPHSFYKLQKAGYHELKPLFVVSVNESVYMKYCLYVRKEDKLKSIMELKSKRFGTRMTCFPQLLLHESSIQEKFFDFFEPVYLWNANAVNESHLILANKIDVFYSYDFIMKIIRKMDSRFKKIEQLTCIDYHLSPTVYYNNKLDEESISKIADLFLSLDVDQIMELFPEFEGYKSFLKNLKIKAVPYKNEYMERTKEIVDLEEKMGWLEDQRKWLSQNEE